MTEFGFVFALGAVIALLGWWIGRGFALPGGRRRGRGGQPVRLEILISDIERDYAGDLHSGDMAIAWRSLRRAARLVSGASTVSKKSEDPDIHIDVRRIGRWTFADSVGQVLRDGSRADPGIGFLKDNQLVFAARRVGASRRMEFAPQPFSLGDRDYSSRTFGLDRVTLDPSFGARAQSRHLAAYLACLSVARSGGDYGGGLLDVAEEILGRSGRSGAGDFQANATHVAENFERDYMAAWLGVERGIEEGDIDRLLVSLGIYGDLIEETAKVPAQDVSPWLTGQMLAHRARAALAIYELQPNQPERLLEAHEYCGRAIAAFNERGPGGTAGQARNSHFRH